ncbi:hypothetical protein OJAV_G00042920 [Oryzias javanicus]|uniref:Uncharacterized protein n=1 Tax=Oryzias javanicus TaxID=123683 RepID=A0A437DCX8_ORYJA|nr:hypothetical protein OJAV_G00042920 [Oryzias javanicus]
MAEAVRRQLWRGDGQDSAPAPSFPFSSERARVRPAPAAAQALREGGREEKEKEEELTHRSELPWSRAGSAREAQRPARKERGKEGRTRRRLLRTEERRSACAGEAWPRPHSDVLCAQFGLETNHGLICARESAAAARDRSENRRGANRIPYVCDWM